MLKRLVSVGGRLGSIFAAVAVAVLLAQGSALALPVPALEFWFDDASGMAVPNHGSLGATGNGTLGAGTTWATGAPTRPSGYLVIDSSTDIMSTADIDSLDTLNSFTLSIFVKPFQPSMSSPSE